MVSTIPASLALREKSPACRDTVVCSPCPVCDDREVCLAGECVTDPGTGFAALLQWYNGSNLDLYVLSPFSKWSVCTVSPTNPLLEEGEEEFEYQGLCDVGTYEVDCDGTCANPQHDYVIYQSPANRVFQVTVVGDTLTEPTHYLLTIFNNGIVKTLTDSITKNSPIVNVPFDCGDCLGDEYLFIYDGADDSVCNDYQDCGVVWKLALAILVCAPHAQMKALKVLHASNQMPVHRVFVYQMEVAV
jgi:hypothetical protein